MITLRPGLLVSLKTSIAGGVKYAREELGSEVSEISAGEGDDASKAKIKVEEWKTKKTVDDVDELERATKTRSKCRSLIAGVCSNTSFGLLCLGANEKKLDEAIAEARALAAKHNETAKHTQVGVFVLRGRIAENEKEAAQAIASEMRDLLADMERGVREVNPDAIRRAANDARRVGKLLGEEAGKKAAAAVEEARRVATEMVKKLKGGEQLAEYAAAVQLESIQSAHAAFLDMDAAVEVAPLPVGAARALDVGCEETAEEETEAARGEEGAEEQKAASAGAALDLEV